jgi:hypothetical protein
MAHLRKQHSVRVLVPVAFSFLSAFMPKSMDALEKQAWLLRLHSRFKVPVSFLFGEALFTILWQAQATYLHKLTAEGQLASPCNSRMLTLHLNTPPPSCRRQCPEVAEVP